MTSPPFPPPLFIKAHPVPDSVNDRGDVLSQPVVVWSIWLVEQEEEENGIGSVARNRSENEEQRFLWRPPLSPPPPPSLFEVEASDAFSKRRSPPPFPPPFPFPLPGLGWNFCEGDFDPLFDPKRGEGDGVEAEFVDPPPPPPPPPSLSVELLNRRNVNLLLLEGTRPPVSFCPLIVSSPEEESFSHSDCDRRLRDQRTPILLLLPLPALLLLVVVAFVLPVELLMAWYEFR